MSPVEDDDELIERLRKGFTAATDSWLSARLAAWRDICRGDWCTIHHCSTSECGCG